MQLSVQEQDTVGLNYRYPEKLRIISNTAICVYTKLESQVSVEEHDLNALKEEPMPAEEHLDNFETSSKSSINCGESLVSISHLNVRQQELEEDPLALSPGKEARHVSDDKTDHLLSLAAKELWRRLKPNWMYLIEGDGIHIMQLSRNFEKCVQRRLFFKRNGDVHLSVHCVPIPISNLFPCLRMVQLQNEQNISEFVHAMERIVNVVRQLEICTGVCQEKYKPLWGTSDKGDIDKNPYQEARYSITFRSFECSRLVRPRQKMCHSCVRLQDSLRMRARSVAKKTNNVHRHSKSIASSIKNKKRIVE